MSKPLKRDSALSYHLVTCAYCQHQRKYVMIVTDVPYEGIEHIWCPKCSRTFKYDRGTDTALTLETIQMKQERLI
jgi:C4-type Zn-finger protein